MKTLSLIIPAYNAPDLVRALPAHIGELKRVAAEFDFELVETILIDDGSKSPITAPAGITLLRNDVNRGKGYSVRRGALAAKGDWVLMSDVDVSAPLTEFAQLAPHRDAWIVCGSRHNRPGVPWQRRMLSTLFRLLVRLVGGVSGIYDTQCGFKLFRMDVMRAIFEKQRVERFSFDVELISRVQNTGGLVKEIPVAWNGGKRSSLRVLRDAPRMLWDLLVTARESSCCGISR